MGIIFGFVVLAVIVFAIGVLFNLKRQTRLDQTFDAAHRRRPQSMNAPTPQT